MNDKIKQAFEECTKFIDECTPEELQEYEKSLNSDYESYYRIPEQVIEDLYVSSKSIKQTYEGVRYSYNDAPVEDVYNIHYDTAGNLHWIGTKSGEHIIRNGVKTIKLSNTEEEEMNKDKIYALWSDIQHYGERLKQEDFVDNNFGYCTLFGYKYNNDIYCATMINGELASLEKGYAVREESYIDGQEIEVKKIFLPIGYKIVEED